MKTVISGFFALLLVAVLVAWLVGTQKAPSAWSQPEIEYLKAVNRARPQDPEPLFILMGQYANANMQADGVDYFSTRLKELEPGLPDLQKSLYLSAIGLLRAGHANKVPLLKRTGWVKDTIDTLENAKRLSGGQVFVVRWIAGVVYAQLPKRFNRKDTAIADLTWCLENADKAPGDGWLREVNFQMAALYRVDGQTAKAQDYLKRSGYSDLEKPITLTTPFAEDASAGHTFSSKRITETIPGKVYTVSGYEFTEYNFVVSDDGRELIGIDAGTRPDSAKAAYEALRAHAPRLPALTAVLITHSHWDHVGGHKYFRGLNPSPKFYARANYGQEISKEVNAPDPFFKNFFGSRFNMEDVRSFKPDITVDGQTSVTIGGTRFDLIPIEGGETSDGLFIHLPSQSVMFVGDFIMPYLGAPFVEEGNLNGLLDAIDILAQKNPQHLLHGHEPLTRVFSTVPMLTNLKGDLAWLRDQVLAAIQRGDERASIHQANLIPPGLLAGDPGAHQPYLIMRENVINRLYDQNVGYWQPDLQGVDHLSRADRGSLLVDYLGVTEGQVAKATERMIADGKYELAAATLEWTKGRFPASKPLQDAERLTYLKLMEKFQNFNPFKFIIYSAKAAQSPSERRP